MVNICFKINILIFAPYKNFDVVDAGHRFAAVCGYKLLWLIFRGYR